MEASDSEDSRSLQGDPKGKGLTIWTSQQASWGASSLAQIPADGGVEGGMGGSLVLLQTWLLGPSDVQ